MTHNENKETAAFNDKEIYGGNSITISALKGKTISKVEVANNLDYKGSPRCGLWLDIEGTKLGLFLWDITNVVITTFPERNKPEFVRLDDLLHKAALANFGKKEQEFLKAVAEAIEGKKADFLAYAAQTQKGASYQAVVFTVSE